MPVPTSPWCTHHPPAPPSLAIPMGSVPLGAYMGADASAVCSLQNVMPLGEGELDTPQDPETQLQEQEKRIEISCALAAEASRRGRMLSGKDQAGDGGLELPAPGWSRPWAVLWMQDWGMGCTRQQEKGPIWAGDQAASILEQWENQPGDAGSAFPCSSAEPGRMEQPLWPGTGFSTRFRRWPGCRMQLLAMQHVVAMISNPM